MRTEESLGAPVAKRAPVTVTIHGDARTDDYAWLKDVTRTDPDVLAYLEAENAYTESVMEHTEAFQESLYKELLGRIKETDLSVPLKHGDYFYYNRTEEGLQYPIYCRKHLAVNAPEQVILDQNALAEGFEQFSLGALQVSPDHRLLAYSTDTNGSEEYTLYFKDLDSGVLLDDRVEAIEYSLAWAADNSTISEPSTGIPARMRARASSTDSMPGSVYRRAAPETIEARREARPPCWSRGDYAPLRATSPRRARPARAGERGPGRTGRRGRRTRPSSGCR